MTDTRHTMERNQFHDQEDKQWTYHGSRTSNHQRIQLGSLGGYTREHQGSYYEPLSPVYPARAPPLHTVFPLGARHWAPPEGVFGHHLHTRLSRDGPRSWNWVAYSETIPRTITRTLDARGDARKNAIFSPTFRTFLGYSESRRMILVPCRSALDYYSGIPGTRFTRKGRRKVGK